MSWKDTIRPAAAVLLFVVSFLPNAYSQTETATIRGSVADPSGGLIPQAIVRLIDDDRGATSEVSTTTTGFYTFVGVRPGRYRMEVSKSGFKKLVRADVILHVQDALAMDFELSLGAPTETVTVEAGTPLVNTTSATVSTLVDQTFVENIPLNGRSFQTLIMLTPGVVVTQTNAAEQGQFSVNG